MSIQWKRAIRLVVGLEEGNTDALDFSEFRVRFFVKQAFAQQPGSAEIYIYNVNPETMAKFKGEGQAVILQAGYEDSVATIFRGQVRQIRRGRESQTDTFLGIVAQSADKAHNYAVSNASLAAGWTPEDLRAKAMKDFADNGVEAGELCALPGTKMPRGRVMYGQTRKFLNDIAENHDIVWGYEGERVRMDPVTVPADQDNAIVLNSKTGMIGMPRLTTGGVFVSCLLNPLLKFGGQVLINEASIQREAYDVSYGGAVQNYKVSDAALGEDGYWRIVQCEHQGDTRGEQWQTNLVCIGVNAMVQTNGAAINAVSN
jgi:hypothetical protein